MIPEVSNGEIISFMLCSILPIHHHSFADPHGDLIPHFETCIALVERVSNTHCDTKGALHTFLAFSLVVAADLFCSLSELSF